MMQQKRRQFLKTAGLLAGGTIAASARSSMALRPKRSLDELIQACRGVHNFLTTPFQADGALDTEGLRNNVAYHADRHPRDMTIVVSCNLGELFSLDLEEHQAVGRAAVEGAQGKMPVIQGVAGGYQLTLEMARNAEKAGVDALMLFAPPYGSSTARGVYEYMHRVATAVRMGVFVNMWHGYAVAGEDYWAQVIRELARLPNVIGFQDSSGDLQVGHSLGELIPDRFLWIARGEGHAVKALPAGARAYTAAVACLAPKACRAFWKNGTAGNLVEMHRILEQRIAPMAAVRSLRPGYSAGGIKVALETLGRAGGPTRPPMGQVLAEDQPRIEAIVRRHAET
jgi:5-dehydro-4-deoxyglucarate dehydratase